MAMFTSSDRRAAPHRHVAEERCPWCEQPIPRAKFEEISRRIAARERDQHAQLTARLKQEFANERASAEANAKAALEAQRAAAAQAAEALRRESEAKLASARREAQQAAETLMATKLAALERSLEAAEQTKAAALEERAAVAAEQQALLGQRLQELEERAAQERLAAVQAVQSEAFDEKQRLQAKVQDLQRQLESKSAHELGESSELDLFQQLRDTFEGDRIWRVAKGVNGADVIHEVILNGKVCGKIIYDAKNRNAWQNEFVAKLSADRLAERADHAVLSSNKFPKGTQQLHTQDGVIVASPARVLAVADILRRHILQTHALRIGGEQREQKTARLYTFITSEPCKQLFAAIAGQTKRLGELDEAEQKAHRRLWDQRGRLIGAVQRSHDDLCFEIDRIIGTVAEASKPGAD
jgi:hypothetical protein